jgi:two-component system chemotaxis response regulator CheB
MKRDKLQIEKLILIGASTGGPGQIQKIIKSIKKDFSGVMIIAQHMQSPYLHSFSKQLNNNCAAEVITARDNLTLSKGSIYVLPENYEIIKANEMLEFRKYDVELSYSPNINLLFNSVFKIKENLQILCIVLTGIGDDGAIGAFNLQKLEAKCLNESEESSIVYGMPKAASELNPDARQCDINQICKAIEEF